MFVVSVQVSAWGASVEYGLYLGCRCKVEGLFGV